ncbi:hypothetical protein ACIPYQ_28270 [Streptomyces sp. NPDC090045]|uniref:hypothetical protein n=1 Tax=Streptomyces sp. NPDC090045 TaxID=3365927 RepID=UPI00380131A1
MDAMTSDVALPALHRAFVDTARRDGSTAALYACACFAEQLFSDAAAAASQALGAAADPRERTVGPSDGTAGPQAVVAARLRALCTALARETAAAPGAPARDAERRLGTVERALRLATGTTHSLWRSAEAHRDPVTAALLRHATDWKTPECHGYDLADPELSLAQAADWLTGREPSRPVLVVAVRTGGSYLAPFWQAAVEDAGRATGPWHSLRPVRGADAITLPAAELAALPATLPAGTVLVLVDDQPDTGATAMAVRDHLAARFPGAHGFVLAAPGRLYGLDGPAVRLTAERPPVRTGELRLWQLTGHASTGSAGTGPLVARARKAGVPLPAGTDYRAEPFRGTFTTVYGTPSATAAKEGAARRVDPRRRPFTLTPVPPAGSDGAAYHFRFIGTGTHGLHCARTLHAMGDLLPAGTVFADGYLVTPHEPGLRPLREALPELTRAERRRVLDEVARSWHRLRELGELGRPGPDATYDPRERLGLALRRLRDRTGRPLPVDEAWLTRRVPDRAPLGGVHGMLFRTPLPYGHAHWHWQLAGTGLRRFGLDWIWGGGGCLESEIASFLVENRLDGSARDLLREAVAGTSGDTRAFDAGLHLAGEALYWNVKTWLRRYPAPAGPTVDRVTAELEAQAAYVETLG